LAKYQPQKSQKLLATLGKVSSYVLTLKVKIVEKNTNQESSKFKTVLNFDFFGS